MMGAPENVRLWHMPQFPHNYNSPSRHAVYEWFNKHFALGWTARSGRTRFSTSQAGPTHRLGRSASETPGGPDFERKLLRWWDEDAQRQIAPMNDRLWQAWRTLIVWDTPAR